MDERENNPPSLNISTALPGGMGGIPTSPVSPSNPLTPLFSPSLPPA